MAGAIWIDILRPDDTRVRRIRVRRHNYLTRVGRRDMSSDVWLAVDESLADLFVERDAGLEAALEATAEAGMPPIGVSRNLGKLLYLMVQMSGTRRILEIGTLGGYSTIWLARALPPDGVLISLELLDEYAAVARKNVKRAGLSDVVEIRVGAAKEGLAQLAAEDVDPFDFVFIDADKEGYSDYLAGALGVCRAGTVIVADNVVRDGAVFDDARSDPVLEGVRSFLDDVAANPRLSAVGIQLVGAKGYDGIAIARVAG